MSAQQQIGKFVKPLLKRLGIVGASGTFAGGLTAAGAPRVLHKSVTSAQTGANTDETTLWSYSLPAGTLASDGQAVRITVFGTTAANGNTKNVMLKFGATTLGARTTPASEATWQAVATVMRSGATAQVATAQSHITGGIAQTTTAPAETLANAITIVCTGTNGTANAGDITFRGAIVEFLP